jgi:hypothetical protein
MRERAELVPQAPPDAVPLRASEVEAAALVLSDDQTVAAVVHGELAVEPSVEVREQPAVPTAELDGDVGRRLAAAVSGASVRGHGEDATPPS